MPDRAKELYFVGPTDPNTGEPMAWFNGIPARDLDEAEVAALSDDDYKMVTESDLYQVSKPASAKAAEKPDAKKEG